MARSNTNAGARRKRYALNAAEYLVAYVAGISAVATTYVVVGGTRTDEVARALSQALVEAGTRGAAVIHQLSQVLAS